MSMVRAADINFEKFNSRSILEFQSKNGWPSFDFTDEQAITYFLLFFDPLCLDCLDGHMFHRNAKTEYLDRYLFSKGFHLWSESDKHRRFTYDERHIVRMGILAYGPVCNYDDGRTTKVIKSLVKDEDLLTDWNTFISMNDEEKGKYRKGVILLSTQSPPC